MAKVLVVGASSAIATRLCALYAARGDTLYLLGRDASKLAAVRASLGVAVVGVEAGDFNDTKANGARVARALAALGGVDVAVIAHGWLGDQLVSERSFDHAEEVVATNFLSVVSFLVPLANAMEAAGRGRLVVFSSVAGDRGRPRNYTYGAAKGALTVYLQGLRSRLYDSGVKVSTIRLGPTHSPMTVDHPKNALFAEPEAVARAVLAAADAGKGEVYVPWFWRPIMATVRGLPEAIFQRFGFLAGR